MATTTCSKGKITKTVSGTITVMYYGVELTSITVKDKSATVDSWDNCKCPEKQDYVEVKCITADIPETGKKEADTADVGSGITVKYDLTVDSTRTITNCEYECKPKAKAD